MTLTSQYFMQQFFFKDLIADFFLMSLIVSAHLTVLAFIWLNFQPKTTVVTAAPKVLAVQLLRYSPPSTPVPVPAPEPVVVPVKPQVAPEPAVKPAVKPKPVAKTPPAKKLTPPAAKAPAPPPKPRTPAPSLPKESITATTLAQESNNNLQEIDFSDKKSTPLAAEIKTIPPQFKARYLNNPQPDYPRLSQRLREEGRVLLKVQVATSGQALAVELHQSSGYARLDAAALTAVKSWRFVPAKQGEQPIVAWVIVPIDFRLF